MSVTIGYTHKGYNEVRSIIGKTGWSYKQQYDLCKLADHIHFKLLNRTRHSFHNTVIGPLFPGCDVLHLFNGVYLGRKNWVTTFESSLPRLEDRKSGLFSRQLIALQKDNCLNLIALSEGSARIMNDRLKDLPGQVMDRIARKVVVLHPPQNALIQSMAEKDFSGPLKLMFIGGDFFRKGGLEMLEAVDVILKSGADLHLTIVSSLNTGDYAYQAGQVEKENALAIIRRYPEQITHVHSMPNQAVLELLKKCHVGLLPTYADTYGYSVLEAQAAGCAVVSTNIRALPEINNSNCGFIIPLETDNLGYAKIATKSEMTHAKNAVKQGLLKILGDALENRKIVEEKAGKAYERIKIHHDPATYGKKLMAIYRSGLGN